MFKMQIITNVFILRITLIKTFLDYTAYLLFSSLNQD